MKQSVKKLVMLLALSGLVSGCAVQASTTENSNNSSTASISSSVSESENSSSNTTSESSSSSFVASSTNLNPDDCTNHQLTKTIIKEATLLEKGTVHYHCPNCGFDADGDCYKMDEFVFDDMSYSCGRVRPSGHKAYLRCPVSGWSGRPFPAASA